MEPMAHSNLPQTLGLNSYQSCFLQFCPPLDLKLDLKLTDPLLKRAASPNITEQEHHFQLEGHAHKSWFRCPQCLAGSMLHLHAL